MTCLKCNGTGFVPMKPLAPAMGGVWRRNCVCQIGQAEAQAFLQRCDPMTPGEEARESMSNPEENQTVLAMAALKAGYYPWRSMKDRFRVVGPITTTLVADVVAPTAIEALAAAAEALGLEPDPAAQWHEQSHPVLTESQRESLLIVAEVSGDLAVNAEAVEIGGRSAPSAAELLAWAEELEQPVRTLHALFDLAPKVEHG